MKLGDLKQIEGILRKVYRLELPIKLAFKFSFLIDEVNKKLDRLEELRVKLVKKYGEQTDKGFTVPDSKVNEFQDEFFDLLDEEITDIEPINIPLELLEDNDIKMSVAELTTLIRLGFMEEPK